MRRGSIKRHIAVDTHGTTRVAPLQLFTLERSHLLPCPIRPSDLGSRHQVSVHRDCHVKFDQCLYSAPFA